MKEINFCEVTVNGHVIELVLLSLPTSRKISHFPLNKRKFRILVKISHNGFVSQIVPCAWPRYLWDEIIKKRSFYLKVFESEYFRGWRSKNFLKYLTKLFGNLCGSWRHFEIRKIMLKALRFFSFFFAVKMTSLISWKVTFVVLIWSGMEYRKLNGYSDEK